MNTRYLPGIDSYSFRGKQPGYPLANPQVLPCTPPNDQYNSSADHHPSSEISAPPLPSLSSSSSPKSHTSSQSPCKYPDSSCSTQWDSLAPPTKEGRASDFRWCPGIRRRGRWGNMAQWVGGEVVGQSAGMCWFPRSHRRDTGW
jgi:hypothetical protein